MADHLVQVIDNRVVVTVAGADALLPLAIAAASEQAGLAGTSADRAEAALAEIEDIAANAADAPSIVNKLNLDGGNVGANATDLREAIGADLAANVNFSSAGTGAVARTAQAKLRERPTPYDYGAVGDGTTDDSAAVSAWMAANKYLRVPLATFSISPGVMVAAYEGQSIKGEGPESCFTMRSGDGDIFNSDGKTVHLQSIRFYGGDDGGKTGTLSPANDRNGLALDFDKRSTITDLVIHGFGNRGVYPINSTGQRSGNINGSNLRIYNNWMGLEIGPEVGEYTRWSDIYAGGNRYGIRVSSGNVYISNPQLNDNGICFHLLGTGIGNDAHGTVVGGCFNHAATWNLHAEGVTYGHTFTGVAMIAGDIWLDDCDGVLITGGQVGASNIHFKDGGRNIITGVATPTYNNVTQHENDNSYIRLIGADGTFPYTNYVQELGLARFQAGVDESIARWGSSGLLTSYGFDWTMGGSSGLLKLFSILNSVRSSHPAISFDRDAAAVAQMHWSGQSAADDAAAAALTPAVPVGGVYYNSTIGALRPRQA